MSEVTAKATKKSPKSVKGNDAMSDTTSAALNGTMLMTLAQAGDLEVALPCFFKPGDTLDAVNANILNEAYKRQFTNNMNANAKAKTDRIAKGGDPNADANRPYTADDILEIWNGNPAKGIDRYMPNVGRERVTSTVSLQKQAEAKAFTALILDHNALIADGQPGILKVSKHIDPAIFAKPRKAKGMSDADHAEKVSAWEATMSKHYADMSAKFPDRVQKELDLLVAENARAKATADSDLAMDAPLF